MMTWPQPTRADHEKFCQVEGWQRVRDATGGTGAHYVAYELVLWDGQVLRTRISHPSGRATYGPAIWSHILRDQLKVDQYAFWECVKQGKLPDRGAPHS